ncbi:MAG: 6,7-dimethyl-8-ribityllumazine synthase [Dialister sp.]|nr:6,7-dimethyl-8-ribityllumazine synthase [Dialister sp.]MDU5888410.1 6,7-dimethyl-8-ribityllumazine synthase [Dialister sp.]
MNIISGLYNESEVKIGVVASRFNEIITSKLIDGVADGLSRHGVNLDTVDLAWVPGAFEVPVTAKKMAESGRYDAVICLGAVIRGETDHYEHVATEVTKGIAQVSLSVGIPVLYGILTTDTVEQALNRAGLKSGNKGFECALDALELASLFKKIKK